MQRSQYTGKRSSRSSRSSRSTSLKVRMEGKLSWQWQFPSQTTATGFIKRFFKCSHFFQTGWFLVEKWIDWKGRSWPQLVKQNHRYRSNFSMAQARIFQQSWAMSWKMRKSKPPLKSGLESILDEKIELIAPPPDFFPCRQPVIWSPMRMIAHFIYPPRNLKTWGK